MSQTLRDSVFTVLSTAAVVSALALLLSAHAGLFLHASEVSELAQADFLDFNTPVVVNSTSCSFRVNGLEVLAVKTPVLELESCRAAPVNGTWAVVERRGQHCAVILKPLFIASNSTLVLYDARVSGYADRLCARHEYFEVRAFAAALTVCERSYALEGAVRLKVHVVGVVRC